MTTSEERLSRLEGVYEHLSSKADVAEVKAEVTEVKADVAGLKADVAGLKTDVAGLKTDVAHLATKADMALQETRLIKWMIGTVVTGMAAAAAVAVAVDRLLGG
jgi:phage shock protein A